MSRVQSRNRSEELELGLEFFSRMHELHEDWLIKRSSVSGVASPAQVWVHCTGQQSTPQDNNIVIAGADHRRQPGPVHPDQDVRELGQQHLEYDP